jgi:hypothetical protein
MPTLFERIFDRWIWQAQKTIKFAWSGADFSIRLCAPIFSSEESSPPFHSLLLPPLTVLTIGRRREAGIIRKKV